MICLYRQSLCQCFRNITISDSLCCQDTLELLLLKTLWSNSVSWRQSRVLSLHRRSIIIIMTILILVMVFLCCRINIEHEPAEISAIFLQLFFKNCTSVTCKDTHENTHFSQCFQCAFAVRTRVSSVASLEFNLRCLIIVRSDLWSTNMCCIQRLLENVVFHFEVKLHKLFYIFTSTIWKKQRSSNTCIRTDIWSHLSTTTLRRKSLKLTCWVFFVIFLSTKVFMRNNWCCLLNSDSTNESRHKVIETYLHPAAWHLCRVCKRVS